MAKAEAKSAEKSTSTLQAEALLFMKGSDSFFPGGVRQDTFLIKVPNTKLQPPDMHSAYALMQYAYDGYIQSKPPAKKKGLFRKGKDVLFE